jgi:DNA-binding NarL/FixJ family response regulator
MRLDLARGPGMNGDSEEGHLQASGASTQNVTPARIALVDDHPLFRIGLRTVLEGDPRVRVVIDVDSGRALLDQARDQPLDITLLDLVLPGTSGAAIAAELTKLQPNCKILALSMLDDPFRISDVLRRGAVGFALKTQPIEEIVEAIHLVLGGVRYLPPSISRTQIEELSASGGLPFERLSPREREVFDLLVRGHNNDEIASRLFIARRTVEAHRHHVMHKLGARSLVDLVRLAVRQGFPDI